MVQPGKGLEYKVIISHVTDFEDWVSSGSGDAYREELRIPFAQKAADGGMDEPHAGFFGEYKVRDPVTGAITTVQNNDDFGLLNQPYHYQDEVHPHIFDKKARGGTDQRDLEFELDVTSITHNWTGLGSALNMPAMRPFTKGDDNEFSVSNRDVGGMVYQLNALSMDLGSQSETLTVQGTCIDRENPPHQDSTGAPHIRKQQLMDIARGQWAGNSGFQFEGGKKDFMTPAFWLSLTLGPVQDRTLQSGVFTPLKTSLVPVTITSNILIDTALAPGVIVLSDNTALTANDRIEIGSEEFLVSGFPSTTNTTVTRAYNSTTAAAHSSGAAVKSYPYTEKYWTGDEPSDDIRGKERLRNEYRPGTARTLSSGFVSAAQSPALDHPEITERKATTYEHNRYPAETEFWKDGWRDRQGFQLNLKWWTPAIWGTDKQDNNPLLRDWDNKFHYDGRSRYRGAIKNLTFTQLGGRPDVWDFNFTFMVVKNETRIRHLSSAHDSAVEIKDD